MKTPLIILLLATGFSAQAMQSYIEPLFGLYIKPNSINIQVASGGCTNKSSFLVKKLFSRRSSVFQLAFVRVVPDNCEGYFPEGRVVSFTYEDLNLESGQSFQIANPLSVYRAKSWIQKHPLVLVRALPNPI